MTTKTMATVAAALAAAATAGSASARLATPEPDRWSAGPNGFWDAKTSAFFTNRVIGAEAKGAVYDEAVNAFRTHADDSGTWQGEYWGKTMLGAVSVAELTRDQALKEWIVTNAVAFVKEFQRADGYVSTYSDPDDVGPNADGSEKFNWNLWGQKYTLWALVEAVRMVESDRGLQAALSRAGSGDAATRLTAAATRLMEREIRWFDAKGVPMDKTGFFVGLPTMSVLKPLMLLYRATGRTDFLRFAERIVATWEREGNPPPNLVANAFGDRFVHEWYPDPGGWAKAYEMMSCLEGVLDYADWKHDRRLVDAVARIAEKLHEAEGNPFGSVGYFDHFSHAKAQPNAITEVCDAIHWMRLCRDLFLATKDPRHLDRFEEAFYNGILPGVFRDGRWAAHGVRSHGTRHLPAPHQVGMKFHQCCVDNLCRAWRTAFETAAALDEDGTLYLNLYWQGNYPVSNGRDSVRVLVTANDYPYSGEATVRVVSGADRPLMFRAPAWADDFRVNGVPATNGWASVRFDAKKPNGTWFKATFRPRVEVRDWKVAKCDSPNPRLFEHVKDTPEMKGMSRREGAAYVTLGPVLLAKSSLVGDTPEQVFEAGGVLGRGYRCSLAPVASGKAHKVFRATFEKEGERTLSALVQDFPSCDVDDPNGAFSIWF